MTFKVGLDVSALDSGFKSHSYRGIGRYVRELSSHLFALRDEECTVSAFDHSHYQLPRLINSMLQAVPAGRQTLRQQIAYPLQLSTLARRKFEVLHFPAHMDAPTWCGIPCAVTVLDLIPLVCADLYRAERPGWRYSLARSLEIRAIRNAALLFAISENTARDVVNLLGIPRDRIVVTPLGVDEKFFNPIVLPDADSLRAELGLPLHRDIVVYLGGLDPRKNTSLMLRAFQALVMDCKQASRRPPVLAMVGRYTEERGYPKFHALWRELQLEQDVIEVGFLTDDKLLQLFRIAQLFFFPSLYEGFGLPPLEAMAAGLPVVTSGASAMAETVGDAAVTFDPSKLEEAVRAMKRVLESPDLAARLRLAGPQRARQFTWSHTARATLEGYRRLAREVR